MLEQPDSGSGQLALRWLRSAPGHASGHPKRWPTSSKWPVGVGRHWAGHTGLVSDAARARRSALAPPRPPTPACARRSARCAPRAARPSPGRRRRPPLRASTSLWRRRGGHRARGTARRLCRNQSGLSLRPSWCSGGFFAQERASGCPEPRPLGRSGGSGRGHTGLGLGLGFDSARRPA